MSRGARTAAGFTARLTTGEVARPHRSLSFAVASSPPWSPCSETVAWPIPTRIPPLRQGHTSDGGTGHARLPRARIGNGTADIQSLGSEEYESNVPLCDCEACAAGMYGRRLDQTSCPFSPFGEAVIIAVGLFASFLPGSLCMTFLCAIPLPPAAPEPSSASKWN